MLLSVDSLCFSRHISMSIASVYLENGHKIRTITKMNFDCRDSLLIENDTWEGKEIVFYPLLRRVEPNIPIYFFILFPLMRFRWMNQIRNEKYFYKVCIIKSTQIYIVNHNYVTSYPDSSGFILARSNGLYHVFSMFTPLVYVEAKQNICSPLTEWIENFKDGVIIH